MPKKKKTDVSPKTIKWIWCLAFAPFALLFFMLLLTAFGLFGRMPSFEELEKLLKSKGWTFARQKGSHRIWISPENELVPIQSFGKTAKSYQVRRILFIMEREEKPQE